MWTHYWAICLYSFLFRLWTFRRRSQRRRALTGITPLSHGTHGDIWHKIVAVYAAGIRGLSFGLLEAVEGSTACWPDMVIEQQDARRISTSSPHNPNTKRRCVGFMALDSF